MISGEENGDNVDGKRGKQRRQSTWKEKIKETGNQARKELVTLIILSIIIIASIVCIGLKIQVEFFTSMVSLLVGLIIKSPLTSDGGK